MDKPITISSNEEEEPPVNYIQVEAPATLPPGYTFQAQSGGRNYFVTVPEGGVSKGEKFEAPVPVLTHDDDFDAYMDYDLGPRGQWKDHVVWGYFRYGIFHVSSCMAFWCTPISMAQTMTRINLNWIGERQFGQVYRSMTTFQIVCAIYGFYILFSFMLEVVHPTPPVGEEKEYKYPPEIAVLKVLIDISFSLYSLFALMKTRESVRAKFNIPQEHCNGCEDLACAVFCSCCTAAQISRQVNEFEMYEGRCFSVDGVAKGAPSVV